MAKKVCYVISMNGGCRRGEMILGSFGGTKNISFVLAKQRVTIRFQMGVKKTFEDFITFRSEIFKDVYRKAYLMHAVLFKEGLAVSSLSVQIDEEQRCYDASVPGFPFLYSMLGRQPIQLSDAWRSLAQTVFADSSKSSIESDCRNCAVQSYLLSFSRQYETDRFMNLWTSFNAYYGYIAQLFEQYIIQKNEKVGNTFKMIGLDNPSQGALAVTLAPEVFFLKRISDDKHQRKVLHDTNRALCGVDLTRMGEMYDEMKSNLNSSFVPHSAFAQLYQIAKDYPTGKGTSLPAFLYYLVVYPYWLRCNYFHGSKAQPVVAACNEPEISDLRVVNFFLQRFLMENIPRMYGDRFLTRVIIKT